MRSVDENLVLEAAALLQEAGADGLSREELALELETNDRTARAAVARIREEGLLPVVSVEIARGRVYRVAQTREELEQYRRSLISRIVHLARSLRGLSSSWRYEDPELAPILERVIVIGGKEVMNDD